MQMVNAIMLYISSPSTIVGEATSIWDLDRPIQISICRRGKFMGGLGFNHIHTYNGGSNANKSLLTWTWTDIYGNLTANETMYWLFKSNIEKIQFIQIDSKSTYILPYGLCKYHRGFLKDMLYMEGKISLRIKELQEQYYVFISDPSAAPNFQLPKPFLTGDLLEAKPDNKSVFYYYNIVVKETRTELNDGSCTVYPDIAGHQSYADCVDQEIRK